MLQGIAAAERATAIENEAINQVLAVEDRNAQQGAAESQAYLRAMALTAEAHAAP